MNGLVQLDGTFGIKTLTLVHTFIVLFETLTLSSLLSVTIVSLFSSNTFHYEL